MQATDLDQLDLEAVTREMTRARYTILVGYPPAEAAPVSRPSKPSVDDPFVCELLAHFDRRVAMSDMDRNTYRAYSLYMTGLWVATVLLAYFGYFPTAPRAVANPIPPVVTESEFDPDGADLVVDRMLTMVELGVPFAYQPDSDGDRLLLIDPALIPDNAPDMAIEEPDLFWTMMAGLTMDQTEYDQWVADGRQPLIRAH